jgi:hypothetical protein
MAVGQPSSELFTKTCAALYGENWKGEASRRFKIRKQTVSEWSAGKGAPIPWGVWTYLLGGVATRATELLRLAQEIKTIPKPEPTSTPRDSSPKRGQ